MRTITGESYLTITELARLLKVNVTTFQYWVRAGRVPAPNHLIGKKKFYHSREIPEIKQKSGLD